MNSIGLSDESKRIVNGIDVSLSEDTFVSLPERELLKKYYGGDRPNYVLSLFVRYLSVYGEGRYANTGVQLTKSEWLDTMRDLTLWSDRLYAESGERGLRETHWLAHLIQADIFRLGRLQFVPRISKEQVSFGDKIFPVGSKYCEVHIPQGEAMSPRLVDNSFLRAQELLQPEYYVCESWLLSPRLKEMLKGGNILSFSARFFITETDFKDRSGERYIFGKIGDPTDYQPRNELVKRVKEAALRGKFLGSARGYYVVERDSLKQKKSDMNERKI